MPYEPLSIECPMCKAKVGEPCTRPDGNTRALHRGRVLLAKGKVDEDFKQIAARIRGATENK
jgi:hypothetical protein